MQKNKIFPMLFLFLVCIAIPSKILPQSDSSVNTLTGFDTLSVLVEGLDPSLEQAGLTMEQIQTDVEIKLRRNGLKVRGVTEDFTPFIYLYVRVSFQSNDDIFSGSITTSLKQSVLLERNKSISVLTDTWDTGNIASVGKNNLRKLRDIVSDQVDKFINDYLKANASTQKRSIKPSPPYTPLRPPSPSKTKQDDSPFTATYVGGNKPPEVEVFNDSNRTLYLDLGQGKMTAYTILSGASQKITLTEGNHNFKASAPRVKTLEGQELFRKGYVYTWRFTIVTVPR